MPTDKRNRRQRHEDDIGILPEGWEERVHTDGRSFFIDHNTRATAWEDPRISTSQKTEDGAINIKDWKHSTVYRGDYHPNHIVIQWFWR